MRGTMSSCDTKGTFVCYVYEELTLFAEHQKTLSGEWEDAHDEFSQMLVGKFSRKSLWAFAARTQKELDLCDLNCYRRGALNVDLVTCPECKESWEYIEEKIRKDHD